MELAGLGSRARQARSTAVIGVVVGFVFSLFNVFTPGMLALGAIELAAVLFLLLPAALLSAKPAWVGTSEGLITAATATILGALVVFGGVEGTGLFWAYLAPFLAFFLKGQKMGWRYSLIFLGLVIVYFVGVRDHLAFAYRYSEVVQTHFVLSLVFYTVIAAAFNQLRDSFFDRLQQKVDQVSEARQAAEEAKAETEAALAAAEHAREHMAQVIWSANLGTWELNVQTGDALFNERAAEISGRSLAEFGGPLVKNWAWVGMDRSGDLQRAMEALGKCLSSEVPVYEREGRTRHKDGRWIWIYDRGRVVEWAEDGTPLRMAGTRQDITDRKEADERQLRALLESAPDAMLMVDAEGAILYANQVAFQMFRYTPEEMATLNVDALVPQSMRRQHSEKRKAFAKAPSARTMAPSATLLARRKDGVEFPIEVGLSPFRINEVDVVIASITDISERVRGQNRLVELTETLDLRVKQRTQELGLALERAELAKRSRGEFLANMSHEIRTPMNAVMGMVYLALRADPSPQQREYLEKIQTAGGHLMGIISDILDFSKIDAGKLELDAADFDLERVLQNILQMTEGRARDKGLALRLEMDSRVRRHVRGDSLRLGQILINYVNNAIKFTEAGSVVVRMLRTDDDGPGFLLRFEVQDTGIGLDEEQISRMFQSFEQGDNSTTRRFGGTGLGLAISKQLANLMQGEVGVTSKPGVGSTFWFTARLQEATGVVPSPTATTRPEVALQTLVDKCVLVVDDSDFNLDVAQGVLEDVGVQVVLAADGAQALARMRAQHFDAVLMDMHMPVMDGLEATRLICADPALAATPVIGLTANASRDDHAKCLDAGMRAVLTKPIDPEQLFATLADHLSAEQGSPQPVAVPAVAVAQVDLAVWDAAVLQRTVGANVAIHRKLLLRFLHDARELHVAIDRAVAQGRYKDAADHAHKLKSSARTVGAMRLGASCQALEDASRAGDGPAGDAAVLQLTRALEQAEIEIGASGTMQ